MSLAYHDGKFVEKNSITVSAADFGFARGVAVFELTRVYGGAPFHLEDHLERFEQGVKALDIDCNISRDEIKHIVAKLIAENKYPHSAIKFYATIGECSQPGQTGFGSFTGFTSHLMIMEDEVKPQHPEAPRGVELYRRGLNVKLVPLARQIASVKSVNYAPGFVVSREWARRGWDEVLLVHHDGTITETPTANIFMVIDGKLCTPADGMLMGVTRQVLLELAKAAGMPVEVRGIMPAELARATEAFVTGSFAEMLPVKKVDDYVMATTTEGPVFKKLRQAFTDYVKEHCGSN